MKPHLPEISSEVEQYKPQKGKEEADTVTYRVHRAHLGFNTCVPL